jgi:hypothetical protein
MKFIWESKDIRVGRIFLSKDRYKKYVIAIDSSIKIDVIDKEDDSRYAIVSLEHQTSCDGVIIASKKTPEFIAKFLNECEYVPIIVDNTEELHKQANYAMSQYINSQKG